MLRRRAGTSSLERPIGPALMNGRLPCTMVALRASPIAGCRWRHVLLLVGLAIITAGCRGANPFPAEGTLAGQRVSTKVDSKLAKYHLENYLAGRRTNADYDDEIDRALAAEAADALDRDTLRRLSRSISTDFAALEFVNRVYGQPANRRAQDRFQAWFHRLRDDEGASAAAVPEAFRSYLLAFAPGYAYRYEPGTGADFIRQRRLMIRLGFQTLLIETDEFGTVEKNAAFIAATLERLADEHEKVILISTSKAGPEVAMAVGELLPPQALGHVRAWISIGGLLRGSPLADRWDRWPLSWAGRLILPAWGYKGDVMHNLSTDVRRPAFDRLRFPPHLLMLQYIGVPLSGNVGPSAEDRYRAMRKLGPNDGLTLLADEIVPGGIAVTEIGLDHFYRHPAIDLKALALAYTVLENLEGSVPFVERAPEAMEE